MVELPSILTKEWVANNARLFFLIVGGRRWGATKAMREGRLGIPAQRKILLSFWSIRLCGNISIVCVQNLNSWEIWLKWLCKIFYALKWVHLLYALFSLDTFLSFLRRKMRIADFSLSLPSPAGEGADVRTLVSNVCGWGLIFTPSQTWE